MVQVLWLLLDVDVRVTRARATAVDQLAVLDDRVTVADVIRQEPLPVNVLTVEELQLSGAEPLEGGHPVERGLLVAVCTAAVGTARGVLTVRCLVDTVVSDATRLTLGTTFTEGSHPARNALAVLASTPDRVSLCIGHQATLFPASTRKVGAKYEIRALLHPTGAGEVRATEYEWVSYPLSFVNTMN